MEYLIVIWINGLCIIDYGGRKSGWCGIVDGSVK